MVVCRILHREDFDWAVRKALKAGFSKAEFFSMRGLCVQCMHIGAYDDGPVTVDAMHRFMEEQRYALDITDRRNAPRDLSPELMRGK